ncbi:hypothetical protein COY27_05945 [Candidatus Woesearchaeota archaeon CG_4_10_14_0_2_um_filter_33_13]|nr:MAG: hypothetical protein COY27_05945 [Candidatus Woesearchaeota archaeon CG_4_10_14_0_2_um_filter_33_13]
MIFSILYNIYGFTIGIVIILIFTLLGFFLQIFVRKSKVKRIWQGLSRLLCNLILKLLFLRIKVEGLENIPSGQCIITPNQLSHLDGIVVKKFVKKDIFAITEPFDKFNSFAAFWMKKLSFVDLRRTKEEDQRYPNSHSRKEAMLLAEKQLNSGLSLLIFPEGHFERDKQLKKFYPGAVKLSLATGVPIVPVSIQGTEEVWPPDKMLRRPATIIIIKFGRPFLNKIMKKPTERLIKQKVILLKKEIAKMLPQSFLSKRWEKNV